MSISLSYLAKRIRLLDTMIVPSHQTLGTCQPHYLSKAGITGSRCYAEFVNIVPIHCVFCFRSLPTQRSAIFIDVANASRRLRPKQAQRLSDLDSGISSLRHQQTQEQCGQNCLKHKLSDKMSHLDQSTLLVSCL